jgi:type VI secretion system protein ImpA
MIDIEDLLSPIRDDSPSGPDLRLDPEKEVIFGQVKDFRQAQDPAVDPAGKGKEPDWGGVLGACEEALRTETKDLELMAYLTEGLAQRHGFAGLQAGIALIRRSLETHWDSIHPGVDEDGISGALRARWVSWLGSSEFQRVVKLAPINRPDPAEDRGSPDRAPDLSWADYEGAQMLGDQTLSEERRKELIDAGYMSLEEFRSRVGATPPAATGAVLTALEVCVSEIQALERFAEERFEDPDDHPNLFPLRSLLEEVRDFLSQRVPAEGETGEGVEAAQQTDGAPSASATEAAAAAGPVGNRQDALTRLREVEDYFRRTEPHSPISYLIGRAVRWGNMSFEDLVRDLARDKGVLGHIWETLGLDNEDGEGEE